MKTYCTIEDVLSVAIVFKNDVLLPSSGDEAVTIPNTNTISTEEVDYIISEASEMVRAFIKPQYASAVIDSYVAGYPPVIIYLTKTYAAMLMLERYKPHGMKENHLLIDSLKRSRLEFQQVIANGALADNEGNLVARIQVVDVLLGRDNDEYKAFDELRTLYEDGRVY